jgi:hypothetical protein
MSRRYIYDKMSPEEFRAYLEHTAAGWWDGYRFAKLFGFDPSGIDRVLRGKQTPTPTQGICAMLVASHPEIIPTLRAFADARATMKERDDDKRTDNLR